MKAKDHPGVYIPPPLLYVAIFFISIFIQNKFPLSLHFFATEMASMCGGIFLIIGFSFVLPAVLKFFKTKNTKRQKNRLH